MLPIVYCILPIAYCPLPIAYCTLRCLLQYRLVPVGQRSAIEMGPGGGEAPEDFTKPRQTIQSPNRQYKAPKRLYKDIKY